MTYILHAILKDNQHSGDSETHTKNIQQDIILQDIPKRPQQSMQNITSKRS